MIDAGQLLRRVAHHRWSEHQGRTNRDATCHHSTDGGHFTAKNEENPMPRAGHQAGPENTIQLAAELKTTPESTPLDAQTADRLAL